MTGGVFTGVGIGKGQFFVSELQKMFLSRNWQLKKKR